jgi:hypothetical protein
MLRWILLSRPVDWFVCMALRIRKLQIDELDLY